MLKTMVYNGYTQKERFVDPKKITIVEGSERGKDKIVLVTGQILKSTQDGKIFTENLPTERWAEVLEVKVDRDNEIIEGEVIGYTKIE